MRLLKLLLVILYMSIQLSGETRSAAHAWVDNTEAQFSYSQAVLSQQIPKVADAETPKDPETKHPVLLPTLAVKTTLFFDANAHYAAELLPVRLALLTSSPRAPPVVA